MYMGGHFQYSPRAGSPLFLDTQEGCTLCFLKVQQTTVLGLHQTLGRGRNGELLLGEVSDGLALGTTEGMAPQ